LMLITKEKPETSPRFLTEHGMPSLQDRVSTKTK